MSKNKKVLLIFLLSFVILLSIVYITYFFFGVEKNIEQNEITSEQREKIIKELLEGEKLGPVSEEERKDIIEELTVDLEEAPVVSEQERTDIINSLLNN